MADTIIATIIIIITTTIITARGKHVRSGRIFFEDNQAQSL